MIVLYMYDIKFCKRSFFTACVQAGKGKKEGWIRREILLKVILENFQRRKEWNNGICKSSQNGGLKGGRFLSEAEPQ